MIIRGKRMEKTEIMKRYEEENMRDNLYQHGRYGVVGKEVK